MPARWRLAAVIGACALVAYASRDTWLAAIGRALVCGEGAPSSEAILIDNFDYEYWLFERSADFQRKGVASRVLVPTTAKDDGDLAVAAHEIANAFARVARLTQWEIIPVREREPVSLNAAYQVREFLSAQHISSVTLVSSAFRSKRSELVYRSVLAEGGITVTCIPVFGTITPRTWTATWHGIQDVGLQFMKLQYYRFWVMPMVHGYQKSPRAG